MNRLTLNRIRDLSTQSIPPSACSPRALDWRETGHRQNRGTILVASTDSKFLGIVGGMVADSGFTPAYPADREAAWLSVTRTQPCIAICDCDAPVERIQRLVFEAWARRVPVLVSTAEQSIDAQRLAPPHVASFTLPVSHEAFSSMLDALLPSAPRAVQYMPVSVGGGRNNVGVRVRALSIVPASASAHVVPGSRD